MTTKDFKEYVKTGQALDTEEIHRFMDEMSDEARRITFRLNTAYRTPDEVRELLSELFGYEVPQSLRVFPPLYADFGKNITVGEHVFINACCHFQDHGGVTIGDGCQIGHNVVFATLNHGLAPEERSHTYPAPIVLGENGTPVIDASPLTMECDVVDIYETDGFDNFICSVANTYAAPEVLDSAGRLDYTRLKPVLFEFPTYSYLATGEVIGKCLNLGKAPGMCVKESMTADGIVRLSKIEVYPQHLDEYMKYATEVGEVSLRTEPGVLTMYAVSEKENPCKVTILETYASHEAYEKHIASKHFQKYKQGTLHMVKSLVLSDQTPLNPANRINNFIQ